MGDRRHAQRVWMGKPEERGYLENQSTEVRIILKCNLKKVFGKELVGLIWLRIWIGGERL
jgi:hypothetical protein